MSIVTHPQCTCMCAVHMIETLRFVLLTCDVKALLIFLWRKTCPKTLVYYNKSGLLCITHLLYITLRL